jgi:hypothetical protein
VSAHTEASKYDKSGEFSESGEFGEVRTSPSPCGRGLGEGAVRLMEQSFRAAPPRNHPNAPPRGRES